LCGAALLTAAISGVLGMAGGIMLLAVMLLFLEPAVAIPIHALAQLASNSSRSLIHARAVRLELLLPFAALVLPAGFMTLPLAQQAPAEGLRLAIGSFVLVSVWRSRWLLLGLDPESVALRPRFALLGAVSGALGPIIGATGPLIAPFFLGIGLTRFEVIGTKAACQTMTHLAKLLLFGLAGFSYFDHLPLLAGMAASVVAGTALGTRVLHRIDDARFIALYKIALTAVAIRLLWGGLPDAVLPF
jgi:uncharacterized membrane protein YfcA